MGAMSRLFFLFIFVYVYAQTLVLYAWQRKRVFVEYNRCMASLERCSKCLHAMVWCLAACGGKACACQISMWEMCCMPCWNKLDGYSTKNCPIWWAKTRRRLQHVAGCCWYIAGRAVIATDDALESSVAQRLKEGSAPQDLKGEAADLVDKWQPDKMSMAISCLERASRHVDGWRGPFQKLRELVAAELGRQINEQLATKGDFEAESAYFTKKTAEKNLGKEEADKAMFDRSKFFAGAGPMERVSVLLDMVEKAGGQLSDADYKPLQPVLNVAAKNRLRWALDAKPAPTFRPLQYSLFCAGTLRALKLPEANEAAQKYKEIRGLPEDWDVLHMASTNSYGMRMLAKKKVDGNLAGIYTVPGSLHAKLQQLLDDTFIDKFTRDRKDGEGVPNRLVLVGATMVQNEQNWIEYAQRRDQVALLLATDPLQPNERHLPKTMNSDGISKLPKLRDDVQEVWLYHGTTAAGAEGITNEDFRLNFAGSGAGTLYGRGIYLAEACSKSDEYTKEDEHERHLLLCRAVLGRINYTDKGKVDATKLEDSCLKGRYHSVLGDREKARGTYREFIVFDDDLVYPAYIIKYRRQYYTV